MHIFTLKVFELVKQRYGTEVLAFLGINSKKGFWKLSKRIKQEVMNQLLSISTHIKAWDESKNTLVSNFLSPLMTEEKGE